MRDLIAFIAGLVFGIGLLAAGMADPAKVKGFLDLAGAWDPSLALVMAAAIAVGLPAFALARRRPRAWTGDAIELPSNRAVDARLLGGAAIFGIGWGIAGICPGPAFVGLGAGFMPAAIFVAALLVGMAVHDRWFAAR